mmetsp:Transcript_16458/g.33821  ORF Transcript_16458/g.33821 Transcript_16458/m.33821 type:complete len:224 (+) Transcript_16458:1272-1943(+)
MVSLSTTTSPPSKIEDLFDHSPRLTDVPATEEHVVVQDVVQVVDGPPLLVSLRQGPDRLVPLVEITGEATKEVGHRHVDLPVPVVGRGIKDRGGDAGGSRGVPAKALVAPPQVPVDDAGHDGIAAAGFRREQLSRLGPEGGDLLPRAPAGVGRQLQHVPQPVLVPEIGPVGVPREVRLEGRPDGVVDGKSEGLAAVGRNAGPVHPCEGYAQLELAVGTGPAEF